MKKIKPILAARIPIGGITYKVLFGKLKNKRKDFDSVGRTDFEDRTITIDASSLTKEEVYFTLFHELIHAAIDAIVIDYHVKDVQDDTFIHPFSRALWGAMNSAALLNKYWEKK